MKSTGKQWLLAAAIAAMTLPAVAQPPERGKGRPGGEGERGGRPGQPGQFGGPPPSPLIRALDADGDGTLSAKEIENAVAALKSLDKNEDGQLDREEIGPPRPFAFGGRGGAVERAERAGRALRADAAVKPKR